VHRQTITRLELGTRKPAWETVLLLADTLGVSIEAFRAEPAPAKRGKQK
jgi:DNA-binding XRE family transcriptional regulator